MRQVRNVETTSKTDSVTYFENARLCGAKAKSTGKPCKAMAVRNKRRCRLHGGAPGSGAPNGNQNALRHGHYTRKAIIERQKERQLLAEFFSLLK